MNEYTYLVIGIITGTISCFAMLYNREDPDGGDYMMAGLLSCLLALAWPFTILLVILCVIFVGITILLKKIISKINNGK